MLASEELDRVVWRLPVVARRDQRHWVTPADLAALEKGTGEALLLAVGMALTVLGGMVGALVWATGWRGSSGSHWERW